jgi:hypothetical protein
MVSVTGRSVNVEVEDISSVAELVIVKLAMILAA